MFLTYVPCGSFFGSAAAPQLRINLGPGVAPLGRRSFGLVPSGPGSASGPFVALDSVARQSATVAVNAQAGTTGASYVWISTPDAPAGQAWSGRADISAAAGWQDVDSASLTYTWTRYSVTTGQPVADGGRATAREFTDAHGDGPGYAVLGFGCDGHAFNVDAVRGGGTTYDFEGIDVTTSISASDVSVPAGGKAVIRGTVRDLSGRITGDPLVLQARAPGTDTWRTLEADVLADGDGVARSQVVVEETTEYRWFRPQSQYADSGSTDPVLVRAEQQASPSPAPAPDPQPAPSTTSPPETPAPQEPAPPAPKPKPPVPQPAPQQPAPVPAPQPIPQPVPEQPAAPAPAPAAPEPAPVAPEPAPAAPAPAPAEQTDTSTPAG
jgi:hypothetical protein